MDQATLPISTDQIEQFCQKHHIRKLAFFGSVLREDFTPESDLDILVEFEAGQTPGLDFFVIEAELTELLGRKVDLQTSNFLSPAIRRHALSEAVTAYELARSWDRSTPDTVPRQRSRGEYQAPIDDIIKLA